MLVLNCFLSIKNVISMCMYTIHIPDCRILPKEVVTEAADDMYLVADVLAHIF